MLAADIGGQPATLVALEAAAPAVDRTLCPEQVVKDLVQARAALPDEGGTDGHHLFHGKVSKDLNAVEGYHAGGKEVGVGEQDGPARSNRSGPARQGGSAGGEPPGQGPVGTGKNEQPGEGCGGRQRGGEAPEQVIPSPLPHRGNEGAEKAAQQKQGDGDTEDPLRAVLLLDLASIAVNGAGPLGIGVPSVPAPGVQRHQIGGGGGCRRPTGEPQALALGIGPPHAAKEGQRRGGAVRQGVPLRHLLQLCEGVRQRKDTGEGGGGVRPGPKQKELHQAAGQDVDPQHHGHGQQPGRAPDLEGEGALERPRQGQEEEGRQRHPEERQG